MAVLVRPVMFSYAIICNVIVQALIDPCNRNRALMHHKQRIRRTSLLAYPCLLFLCAVCFDYAEADSVSLSFIFSLSLPSPLFIRPAFLTPPFRHMIKYKYIPFDIGRKTRYGNANGHSRAM